MGKASGELSKQTFVVVLTFTWLASSGIHSILQNMSRWLARKLWMIWAWSTWIFTSSTFLLLSRYYLYLCKILFLKTCSFFNNWRVHFEKVNQIFKFFFSLCLLRNAILPNGFTIQKQKVLEWSLLKFQCMTPGKHFKGIIISKCVIPDCIHKNAWTVHGAHISNSFKGVNLWGGPLFSCFIAFLWY